MNKYIVMATLLLAVHTGFAQETVKRNSIYAELGGPAGLYSLNFDRIVWAPLPWLKVAPGIGLSVYNNTVADFPIRISALLGPKSHHFELGLGAEPEFYWNKKYSSEYQTIYFGKIGYRYQQMQGGLQFQFAVTPMYYAGSDWNTGWFSLALGYAF